MDNRGSSIVAGEIVSRAPPDGYTLLVSTDGLWREPLLQKMPFDPVKDFSPIALTSRSPNILVVHPSLPAKSVRELIALAKARPGERNYGAGAIGAATHMASELFKLMAGVDIVHIPYKSSGQAVTAIVSGQLQVMFATSGGVVTKTDYSALAEQYAAHCRAHPDVVSRIATGLSPGSRVLEIGCGTGNYLAAIHGSMSFAINAAEHDRGYPERVKQTIY